MEDIKVTIDNVKECFEYYEDYKERFRKDNYSDATCEDFITWSEENLKRCSNCGNIVLKDEQIHLSDDFNADNVCDECIENYGYYE